MLVLLTFMFVFLLLFGVFNVDRVSLAAVHSHHDFGAEEEEILMPFFGAADVPRELVDEGLGEGVQFTDLLGEAVDKVLFALRGDC